MVREQWQGLDPQWQGPDMQGLEISPQKSLTTRINITGSLTPNGSTFFWRGEGAIRVVRMSKDKCIGPSSSRKMINYRTSSAGSYTSGSVLVGLCFFSYCDIQNYLTWSQPVGCRHIRMRMTFEFVLVFLPLMLHHRHSSGLRSASNAWMGSSRLKFNTEKTQVNWIGTWRFAQIKANEIHWSACVANVSVTFDNRLTSRCSTLKVMFLSSEVNSIISHGGRSQDTCPRSRQLSVGLAYCAMVAYWTMHTVCRHRQVV